MANYVVSDTNLTAIADAIRSKGGTSGTLAFPTAFVTAINNIYSPSLQSKSATPTESAQTITPDTGYALNQVDVAAIPQEYITRYQAFEGAYSGVYSNSTLTVVPNGCFMNNSGLTSVAFANATTIGLGAFWSCTGLTTTIFPEATTIEAYTFRYCHNLNSVSIPKVTEINAYAFQFCSSLTRIDLPLCTKILTYAFAGCKNLSIVSAPNLSLISGTSAFINAGLSYIDFPALTKISGSYTFTECSYVSYISLPALTGMNGTGTFRSQIRLKTIYIPQMKSFPTVTFNCCYALERARFDALTTIASQMFSSCYHLLSLYVLGSTVGTLSSNAFTSTPIGGYTASTNGSYGTIYVRASLYSTFITAAVWSLFASRIASLTDTEIEELPLL